MYVLIYRLLATSKRMPLVLQPNQGATNSEYQTIENNA